MNRRTKAVIAGLSVSAAAVACSNGAGATNPWDEGQVQPEVEVINVTENFRDVATFCDHGNRIYLSSTVAKEAGAAPAVVANDPSCSAASGEG